jgi:CRP/FNR family transcriptional regulator, cAMP and macrophage regulator
VERQAEWIAQCLGRPEFAPLAPEDIRELAVLLREERYPAGATVFKIGEPPTHILIVRRGAVELSRMLNGRRVVMQILRSGEVMGDVGLLLRKTAPFDGVALEDTVILSLDSVRFHRLLEQRPRLAWRWLILVSGRLESYQSRVMELLAGGLEAQIASVLVRRAELVGGRRTSVNRVLKRLEEQDLVRVRYGQVEILDEAGLAKAAGLG